MAMEGDLPWGGEHTIQHTDDVLQNHIPETDIILLINVTPINSIKLKTKNKKIKFYKHYAPEVPPSLHASFLSRELI